MQVVVGRTEVLGLNCSRKKSFINFRVQGSERSADLKLLGNGQGMMEDGGGRGW